MSAMYVPTAEWIDPYAGLTDDERKAMVAQFEPPKIPVENPDA